MTGIEHIHHTIHVGITFLPREGTAQAVVLCRTFCHTHIHFGAACQAVIAIELQHVTSVVVGQRPQVSVALGVEAQRGMGCEVAQSVVVTDNRTGLHILDVGGHLPLLPGEIGERAEVILVGQTQVLDCGRQRSGQLGQSTRAHIQRGECWQLLDKGGQIAAHPVSAHVERCEQGQSKTFRGQFTRHIIAREVDCQYPTIVVEGYSGPGCAVDGRRIHLPLLLP